MGAMNKLLEWVGIDSGVEDEFEDYNEDFRVQQSPVSLRPSAEPKKIKPSGKVVSLNDITAQLNVVIMRPQEFDEAQDIANHLKAKKPVVINLEGLDKSVAKRIVDFLSGTVFALDGNIQKVAAGIFFIAPYNVGVISEESSSADFSGNLPWN